jgi:hypothetical protein
MQLTGWFRQGLEHILKVQSTWEEIITNQKLCTYQRIISSQLKDAAHIGLH